MSDLPFDPEQQDEMPAPGELAPDELRVAALRTYYELERTFIGIRAALDYLAELCGATPEDLRIVAERAEQDEFDDLGVENGDGDEAEERVE